MAQILSSQFYSPGGNILVSAKVCGLRELQVDILGHTVSFTFDQKKLITVHLCRKMHCWQRLAQISQNTADWLDGYTNERTT